MLQIELQKKLAQFTLDVKLTIGNEIVGIIGVSGAGKSMLLKCLSGLEKPDSGLIRHQEKTIYNAADKLNLPARKRKIGFLFQHYALFPHMTIEQNIAFGMEGLSKEETRAKVQALLKRFRLTGFENRYPSQISGGQQQRVALARAMATEPDILLLDEPLSALDEHLRNHMLEDLKLCLSSFKGSVLYVTHHMEEAYRISDRIVVMHNGHIVETGAKEALFDKPEYLETAKITGVKNLSSAKVLPNGLISAEDWGIVLNSQSYSEIENPLYRTQSQNQVSTDVYVGIRPNRIRLASTQAQPSVNCFEAWLASIETTPFKTQVCIKLGAPAKDISDYHLQWETSPEQAVQLFQLKQPFLITLPKEQVIYLKTLAYDV